MSKYTYTQKLKLIKEFNRSGIPKQTFAKSKNIPPTTFKDWCAVYEKKGIEGLKGIRSRNQYSYDTKISAVKAYKNGEGTLQAISKKFGLYSDRQLRYWLVKYNNDKNLTEKPVRKKVITLSKKTTLEERIQTVEYVTLQNHSYSEASEHFDVSYQQVRMWVLKVKTGGYSALADSRGHRGYQEKDELSEVDKLKLENRELKAELNKRNAIEAFEKKFNEIQHGE